MNSHCWYILGAGAIGCLWAAYWRRAGVEVVLITPQQRQPLLHLTVQEQHYELNVQCLSVVQLSEQPRNIDRLLVATKAQDTQAALDAIAGSINPHATLLCLQNGMAGLALPERFPNQTLLTAITSDGAYRTAPMAVTHAGFGTTWIGSANPQAHIEGQTEGIIEGVVEEIIAELPTDFLDIRSCDNIDQRQWQKLAINSAINPLTVIYQCANGELLNQPAALQTIKQLCEEFVQVTEAAGIEHPSADQLVQQVEQTLHITANNFSSMYQDIQQKKSTEIDFINGSICQLGHQHGIATPHNQAMVDAVKSWHSGDAY